jgi:iron complex outermembrane recepter protein
MRSIKLLILFLLIFYYTSSAQNTLTGRILNSDTNQPVEFAQVALMAITDSSLVTGGITDYNGRFEINPPGTGSFHLRISFIGYNEKWQQVVINSGTNRIQPILIESSDTRLGEVEITAAASLFRSEADRRIYNVENMTIAEGGTAIQLLETLPSVQVDEEGNLSMRGSGNILIYINGRPSNLSSDETESILEQFPASAIKNVELITNPSARYDAEGVGGIINIVLKEQRMRGANGQVNLSAGTGNKYSGALMMNLRQNRWNFSANYAYQYRESWEKNESFRERFNTSGSPIIKQDYDTHNFDNSHLVRLATEYEINNNSSLMVYTTLNARDRERERTYNISNMATPTLLDSLYIRHLNEDQSRINYEFGTGYNWNNGNGSQLAANASFAWDEQDRIEYFNQHFYDDQSMEDPSKFIDQFYERPTNSRMSVFELDYEQMLDGKHRVETGLKSTLRMDDRSQNFGQRNPGSSNYEEVFVSGIPINNEFVRDENIHAGYLILRNTNSRLTWLAGLRGEFTEVKTFQESGLRAGFLNDDNFIPARDTSTTNTYFSLFPSMFMSFEISQNQDIQANFSRRIRRPGVGAMMPFLNAQDFYNLRLGNPYLEPAFTNNYEVNYIRAWEKYMVTGGVFHRNTTNGITRLFVPLENSSLVTWTNASTTNSTGVELINYFTFNANTDITLTGNYFHSVISGELEGISYNNESYSWTMNMLSNMNIPRLFRVQLAANYWGPRVIPQGEIKQVFSMNLGLRRNVFNNQGTVSVNLSDVFNTRRFVLETESSDSYQKRDFSRESRVLTVAFSWRFRNFRERDTTPGANGIDGDIDGLF